jgi:hypothetical protein
MIQDYYGFIFLFILLIIIIIYPLATLETPKECGCKDSFQCIDSTENTHLLNSYPPNNISVISSDNYSNDYKYYPVFSLGSYEQITNNIRYNKNPDDGTCTPAEFCGSFYDNKYIYPHTNISKMLPPVPKGNGSRVNYYNTPENLLL